ncbi:uncharacterized protein V1518DRAFT_417722 [Limtongia smithiae]|uniref:uncharacterized protein n=1 Tax=Limtongia smithiae TaxID=1125753 RepID=UPI0034CEF587
MRSSADQTASDSTMSSPVYDVYLRFPFPRNGFNEPQPVDWDADKEQELWKVLSRTQKRSEIKWQQLAEYFNVSVVYLLQQAGWLYERELQQVREEMQRVSSQSMLLLNPSRSHMSRESTATPSSDGSASFRRVRATRPSDRVSMYNVDRTVSTPQDDRTASPISNDFHPASSRYPDGERNDSFVPLFTGQRDTQQDVMTASTASRNEWSSSRTTPYIQSSFTRGPRYGKAQQRAEQPFLSSRQAGIEGSNNATGRTAAPGTTSATMMSTLNTVTPTSAPAGSGDIASPSPLSPRQSGGNQASTGSSFSDISETSISRSALEDALLTDFKGNGMASKMSAISGALRSRYFERH